MIMFVLYIHSNNDVIRPIEIDLGPVYAAKDANPGNTGYAMAQEIARQIEQNLPTSQASRALDGIQQVTNFINPLLSTYLNGIAIRVPGNVEGSNGNFSAEAAT